MNDSYYKKTISYLYKEQEFQFEVAESLFSTFNIDSGTDLLLRTMVLNKSQTILDLGCGYGPLGIILAKTNPQAKITMIDSNLLAVKYAKLNANKNKVENVEVLGSIGLEEIEDKTFDLIVSNIPAKIGDLAIEKEFVLNSVNHLNLGGEMWIVVVSALNRLIPKIAKENQIKIKEIKKRHGHTVYQIRA